MSLKIVGMTVKKIRKVEDETTDGEEVRYQMFLEKGDTKVTIVQAEKFDYNAEELVDAVFPKLQKKLTGGD